MSKAIFIVPRYQECPVCHKPFHKRIALNDASDAYCSYACMDKEREECDKENAEK